MARTATEQCSQDKPIGQRSEKRRARRLGPKRSLSFAGGVQSAGSCSRICQKKKKKQPCEIKTGNDDPTKTRERLRSSKKSVDARRKVEKERFEQQ